MGGGGGVGYECDSNHPQTLLFTAILPLHATCCRRMFDVQQHEALSQVFMPIASIPQTLLFAAFLPLYTTCCWRMFDVQPHKALSQVFMPFCEHAQTLLYAAFCLFYTMCVSSNTSTAGSSTGVGPQADVVDHLGKVC